MGGRGVKDTGRAHPTESPKRVHAELTETEVATMESACVCVRPFAYIVAVGLCSGETPDSESQGISDSFACL